MNQIDQFYMNVERKLDKEKDASKVKDTDIFNKRLAKLVSLIALILKKAETEYSTLYRWIEVSGRKHISWRIGEIYKVNCHIKIYLMSNGNILVEMDDLLQPKEIHPESIGIDSQFGIHDGCNLTVDMVLGYLEKFAADKFEIDTTNLV